MTGQSGKDDWSIPRHVRELVNQLLTVSGMMLAISVWTTVHVLMRGPEFAVWPSIIFCSMTVFNHTGRWIIPQFMQQWFAAKNGTVPTTSAVTMTTPQGTVSATVTPTEPKP